MNVEKLLQELMYDPNDGNFYWMVPKVGRPSGRPAGTTTHQGYTIIAYEGEKYKASRLAWYYMTGSWPNGLVGYKNNNPHDTSWDNLKLVTHEDRLKRYRINGDLITRKPPKVEKRVQRSTFSNYEVHVAVQDYLKDKVLIEGVYVSERNISGEAPTESGVLSQSS